MNNIEKKVSECLHRDGNLCTNKMVGEHVVDESIQACWFCSQCLHFLTEDENKK